MMESKLKLAPEAPPDPFDLEALRLRPDYIETAGVKKLLTTIPIRKPHAQEFVRTHPTLRVDVLMLDLREDREEFLVLPQLMQELADECTTKTVYVTINRQGVIFLWPVRLPRPDDRPNEWTRSAREAAEMAADAWIRVKSNQALGAYEISLAQIRVAEPEWPNLELKELLRIAFRDRIITAPDHPVIKRLRGLA